MSVEGSSEDAADISPLTTPALRALTAIAASLVSYVARLCDPAFRGTRTRSRSTCSTAGTSASGTSASSTSASSTSASSSTSGGTSNSTSTSSTALDFTPAAPSRRAAIDLLAMCHATVLILPGLLASVGQRQAGMGLLQTILPVIQYTVLGGWSVRCNAMVCDTLSVLGRPSIS